MHVSSFIPLSYPSTIMLRGIIKKDLFHPIVHVQRLTVFPKKKKEWWCSLKEKIDCEVLSRHFHPDTCARQNNTRTKHARVDGWNRAQKLDVTWGRGTRSGPGTGVDSTWMETGKSERVRGGPAKTPPPWILVTGCFGGSVDVPSTACWSGDGLWGMSFKFGN